jgi:hypothetical protein
VALSPSFADFNERHEHGEASNQSREQDGEYEALETSHGRSIVEPPLTVVSSMTKFHKTSGGRNLTRALNEEVDGDFITPNFTYRIDTARRGFECNRLLTTVTIEDP